MVGISAWWGLMHTWNLTSTSQPWELGPGWRNGPNVISGSGPPRWKRCWSWDIDLQRAPSSSGKPLDFSAFPCLKESESCGQQSQWVRGPKVVITWWGEGDSKGITSFSWIEDKDSNAVLTFRRDLAARAVSPPNYSLETVPDVFCGGEQEWLLILNLAFAMVSEKAFIATHQFLLYARSKNNLRRKVMLDLSSILDATRQYLIKRTIDNHTTCSDP